MSIKRAALLLVANAFFALLALLPVVGFVAESFYRSQLSSADATLYGFLFLLGVLLARVTVKQWLFIYRSLAFHGS